MDFYDLEEQRQIYPKKFTESLSQIYEINIDSLEKLQEDFEILPRGAFAPDDEAAVDSSMTEIAEDVNLPVKVVGRLQDIGVIDKPISYKNVYFLKIYQKTWGNVYLLKKQLARFSQAQKDEIFSRPELATKWEKWVYTRYFKNEINYAPNGKMISPEKRIRVEKLAEQVEDIFGVPDCLNTRNRIKKIREMAYNDKKRGKSEGFLKGRF